MLDPIVVLIVIALVALVAWQEWRLLQIRNGVSAQVTEFAELARTARQDFLRNQESARASALAMEQLYAEAQRAAVETCAELVAANARLQATGATVTAVGDEIARWQGDSREAAARLRLITDDAIEQVVAIFRRAGVDLNREPGEKPSDA